MNRFSASHQHRIGQAILWSVCLYCCLLTGHHATAQGTPPDQVPDYLFEDAETISSPVDESRPRDENRLTVEAPRDTLRQDALQAIAGQMRIAEVVMRRRQDTARSLQIQEAILARLQAVLGKENPEGSARASAPGSTMSEETEAEAGKTEGDPESGTGQSPEGADGTPQSGPRESSLEETGPREATANRRELLEQAWGHLPEGYRPPVGQGARFRFVPRYERWTEQYFRRLAEPTRGSAVE